MRKHKVSVVIPAYNAEKTLRRCLESALDQTYENYDVIVVDNHSTDKTKEMIEEFKAKDPRIHYVFEFVKGRGAARNVGIEKAECDIVAMTDSDCVVPEDWLERLIMPITEEGESAVMGSEKNSIKNYWATNIQKANEKFLKRLTNGGYIALVDTKNFAIRTSIIKTIMFDSRFEAFEDYDFYLRLKSRVRIRFVPSVIVEHTHKSSFRQVVKLNFERAYWTANIYKKFKGIRDTKREPMFESISVRNFCLFPFWMVLQFLLKPRRAFFILVSELSWRTGIIWGLVKNEERFTYNLSR